MELEKVELVREKTGVSYDDAKVALEASNGDVLDAIIWLERMGKAQTQTAAYTTSPSSDPVSPEMVEAQTAYEASSKRTKVGESFSNLFKAFKRLCKKGFESSFVVERKGSQLFAIPTTILVFLILWWGAAIPLLIIGLFCGCHYYFEGAGNLASGVNQVMGAAADGADSIKKTVMGDEQD